MTALKAILILFGKIKSKKIKVELWKKYSVALTLDLESKILERRNFY